ncbi:MAG: DNA-3-methyladenine glycosylase I [Spirochaetia bacterium]|jgi:DNA-3-methyladenine glycosylase I|uniref:DNA-3-methyladenine glycosylase 1 n=1 Tax=bioreactor metagenome TaxID=1076179 RepID=A0A644TLB7_9ZZZZ|nr:DNA-3-methyladenine glycosylase I [Spirochaetia bacterium]MDD3821117.1 DNA-3-methyladenine glycosylase I [Spirochaetales bacterium]NLX44629.1 DNA-3-methyladenine glycosylase I [Treponema sp.]VBB39097.1 putative DNA-3-methyladenine glycosylase 1 [uncultured Spirochaetota bacterium]HAP54915.1 DNA-3-methyladenine glycosylase I [Spirochaetaceae bacterium]
MRELQRCPWCGADPMYLRYHDEEWGTPLHDEQRHFEFLLLETMQAGLSWRCILGKREAFRQAFDGFDVAKVAAYTEIKIESLLRNPGIIRNRRKIEGAVKNARAFMRTAEEFGSFDAYIWSWTQGKPLVNHWRSMAQVPSLSPLSDAVAADMKKRGFSYVGSTTIYAHLQAIGVINDHLKSCYRWKELSQP